MKMQMPLLKITWMSRRHSKMSGKTSFPWRYKCNYFYLLYVCDGQLSADIRSAETIAFTYKM